MLPTILEKRSKKPGSLQSGEKADVIVVYQAMWVLVKMNEELLFTQPSMLEQEAFDKHCKRLVHERE